MKFKERLKNKKGIVTEVLPYIIIAIGILTILVFAIVVMKGKGISVIDKFKGIFR